MQKRNVQLLCKLLIFMNYLIIPPSGITIALLYERNLRENKNFLTVS
jgi:hypothetical protein